VYTDESAMTGEDIQIQKETLEECLERLEAIKNKDGDAMFTKITSPILLSGTQVLEGEGWFIAIAVGKNSVVGKVLTMLAPMNKPPPVKEKQSLLQMKLSRISESINKIVLLFLKEKSIIL